MKWFKHDSDAHRDVKLKRLMMKYGMQGYGLYWYCIELITNTVDEHNLTFELEHDAEVIAHDTGIHFEMVQEMMTYMINLELFEQNDGVITCLKIAKRLDKSMTSSPAMRKLLDKIRKNHDSVMTQSGEVMQDKTRLDKTRINNTSKSYDSDFLDFWETYPRKEDKLKASRAWKKLTTTEKKKAKEDSSSRYNETEKRFIPLPTSYLNGKRWDDEIATSTNNTYAKGAI